MIIVITGPTAVGKTKLSISLAKLLNGEIINADSTGIYKMMNIGTAKITTEEMENIPHHLIDVKDVIDNYTVYDYQKDGRRIIKEIQNRCHIPIIVGGSALYIKALLYDYRFNKEEKINEYSNLSNQEIIDRLINKEGIDTNNRRRLVRALNYQENTQSSISLNNKGNNLLYKDVIFIGLTTDRNILYDRINKRVDDMFNNGLIEEVRYFYDKGIKSKALSAIGYKELYNYFDGEITLLEAKNLIKQKSRNYAKRQYTFMNNKLNIKWFFTDYENFENTIKEVYEYIGVKKHTT